MAKGKKKSNQIVFSTANCSHSMNDVGESCCFCFATVAEGAGRQHLTPSRWVLPVYPEPTPPPFLTDEQMLAWRRGIVHATSGTKI